MYKALIALETMKKITLRNKFVTSFLLAAIAIGGSLSVYSFAQAKLLQVGNHVIVNGMVTSINMDAQTFTFKGSSTEEVTVMVTNQTNFAGSLNSLADLAEGDMIVLTDVKTNGTNYAMKIKLSDNNYGYGQTNPVVVNDATVVSKSGNLLTVKVGVTNAVFTILPSTQFVGTTYATLEAGDKVMVRGYDAGDEYLTRMVKLK